MTRRKEMPADSWQFKLECLGHHVQHSEPLASSKRYLIVPRHQDEFLELLGDTKTCMEAAGIVSDLGGKAESDPRREAHRWVSMLITLVLQARDSSGCYEGIPVRDPWEITSVFQKAIDYQEEPGEDSDKTASGGSRLGQRDDGPEQWEPATRAAKIANDVSGVGRDWSCFWRRFCIKHGVRTRPATKADGSKAKRRSEVEIGSLVRTIFRHTGELETATPEEEVRRQKTMDRLRQNYIVIPEIKEAILAGN